MAGFNATYSTFLYGDVIVKLFGYTRSWRKSHAVQALVAIDRSFHTVASSVSHCGFTPGQGDAHAP